MLNLREIHKPLTIEDALKLLQQPNTVALAGGTQLLADKRREVKAIVDLSALGLAYIKESSGAVTIGAMTTLATLDESPILRALANGVVAQAAHRSASSILRNQATVAGTLIAEPTGILAAAFLALDARVKIAGNETRMVAMENFLGKVRELTEKAIVTEISVPMANPRASLQTVSRTPRDKPIVSVVAAARIENGIARAVRIALGGVGETALRAHAVERALEGQTLNEARVAEAAKLAREGLSPHGDFRGSAEYRQEMAVTLTRRALKELMN